MLYAGEWWKKNVMEIEENANKTGGEPALSDAYTINGHPGDFYPCSKQGIHPSHFSFLATPNQTSYFNNPTSQSLLV